jgi:hypothetical protein
MIEEKSEESREVKDKIRTFFVASLAIIEEHSAKLIYKEMVQKEYRNHDILDEISSFSQSRREDILYNAGIIDGKLYSKMQDFRGTRNEVAHNYAQPLRWKEELEEKAEKGPDIFEEIHDLL